MKSILILFILIVVPTGIFGGGFETLKLKNVSNQYQSIKDLQGETLTVIDFWATWCKPCVASMPKLNTLYNEFQNKGVEFIGLNVDGTRNTAKVRPFVQSMGIEYPVLLDLEKEAAQQLNISAIPTLIILDKEFNIVYRHEGFQPGDEVLLKEKLNEILTARK